MNPCTTFLTVSRRFTSMNDEELLTFLEKARNEVLTLEEVAEETDLSPMEVKKRFEDMLEADRTELFAVGREQFMFSSDKDLVAYQIFKQVAPMITKDEWEKYRDDLPRLMFISRKRMIGAHRKEAKKLMEKMKE